MMRAERAFEKLREESRISEQDNPAATARGQQNWT
jgi:hypothetical protein